MIFLTGTTTVPHGSHPQCGNRHVLSLSRGADDQRRHHQREDTASTFITPRLTPRARRSPTNNADGVVNLVAAGAGLLNQYNTNDVTGDFDNLGTLHSSSGSGISTISIPVQTSLANINVVTGTLKLAGGGKLSAGTTSPPSGTVLEFWSGTYNTTGNIGFSGARDDGARRSICHLEPCAPPRPPR